MNNEVTLCLDSESLKHPEVIGLPDENLLAQPWLTLYSDAFEARKSLAIGNTKLWYGLFLAIRWRALTLRLLSKWIVSYWMFAM